MSFAPAEPYQPYAEVHENTQGPGDTRPIAFQIIRDNDAAGKLKGKTILITGCSAGIGVETARALYETGAQLYLTARDMPKLDKVIDNIVANAAIKDAPRPKPLEIHLDSLDSVRKGAEEFKKQSPQLNILINNAGVMACSFSKTKDNFELQIGTNHFAHFLLFQLLKPLLLSSSTPNFHSRVINLSSAVHRIAGIRFNDINFSEPDSYDKWKSYGQSKSANIYMSSSIERHYGSQDTADYERMGLDKIQNIVKSPPQGAATSVWAAVSDQIEGKNGGRYLGDCGECGAMPAGSQIGAAGYSEHIYIRDNGEKLWDLSYDLLGLTRDY